MKTNTIQSIVLLSLSSLSIASASQLAYLYQDPKVMARGGADVAVGGSGATLFSNPAGLMNLDTEENLYINLLPIGITASKDFQDIYDRADYIDRNNNDKVIDFFTDYSGNYLHLDASSYSSFSKNNGVSAWSVGLLAAAETNFVIRANGSPNGGFFETQTRIYGGVGVGYSQTDTFSFGELSYGASIKLIKQQSYEGALLLGELTDEDEDYFKNKFEKKSTGVGLDLGVLYTPTFFESFANPQIGLSILNIGSMDMDDNYGGQPTTVNIGASIKPLEKLIITTDYVDLFNANTNRIYTFGTNNKIVSYKDYEDADFGKRFRMGATYDIANSRWFGLSTSLGLYQGDYTAGLSVRLSVFEFSFSTYQEDFGTGDVELLDRRYIVQLNTTW